jgi:zinc/manganese transport system permease protein
VADAADAADAAVGGMSRLAAVNPGLGQALGLPFFQHALIAGTAVALACGVVGYFVVLRAQVFTGDALGHVAVTAALAALAFGVDVRIGLFVGTVGVGAMLGVMGRQGQADDVAIGAVFAWLLGLGALFLRLYASRGSTGDGTAGISVLFGSIFGLDRGSVLVALGVSAGVCALTLAVARPLLFASLDSTVAGARGVPVRALGIAFGALVGLAAGEAVQAVGALLLLGLIAAPAATAHRLTRSPYRGLALAAALAVAEMWAGLFIAFAAPVLPPSFAILAVATAGYALTYLDRPLALLRRPAAV